MSRQIHNIDPGDKRTVVNLDPTFRLGGFAQLPHAVLGHPSLSFGAKVVYGVLLSFSWQKDFCKPAQEAIANRCGGVSVRQVQRLLGELRDHGAVEWRQMGLRLPNRYFIQPLDSWIKTASEADATDVSLPDATDSASQDTTDPLLPEEATDSSDKEDPSKKRINVDVESTRSRTSASPDIHGYSGEQLEARIFQLRTGLSDQSSSDFNVRQVVKKLPTEVVDEAYFQAVGRAADGKTANAVGYFIGICKIKAEERGVNLGFTGKGIRSAARKPTGPTVQRDAGPQSIKDIRDVA